MEDGENLHPIIDIGRMAKFFSRQWGETQKFQRLKIRKIMI